MREKDHLGVPAAAQGGREQSMALATGHFKEVRRREGGREGHFKEVIGRGRDGGREGRREGHFKEVRGRVGGREGGSWGGGGGVDRCELEKQLGQEKDGEGGGIKVRGREKMWSSPGKMSWCSG